jgi:PAS domain S-box-containing protein
MNPTSWFRAGEDSGLKVLWEDGERVFCRKESHADRYRAPVLVVLPAAEHPTAVTLDRLAREYALKDELDGTWAVRPLELVRERGRIMLVLEDTRGEPLDQLLGLPMEVRSFLRLAIAVAAAVSQVHRRDLVHKDIKPANILVNRTTGEVKLTGFGIASRLPRERQPPAPPESIAGTLAYMAPEQTGRMNRSIDARSDLYAVGVTFYQMLTGSLPFTAVDPMEWVHCHIARKPEPPSERLGTVPVPVSALILKLLAKNAEERYQTAAGVEWDLRRCLAQLESGGRIDDFPLGQQDTPDRLLIPEKLYGRAREVETLLAAFDRVVVSGRPELVLVSGYSGIGKSAVVNELHKALVPPRGLFASGKFDQYKRDIPYATLVQAFQSLVRPLLSRSDAELSSWRDALVEALGANGRLMVDLVPELKLIVGEPPPVPELPPQQAQARFQLVFRRFIGVFARQEHPLALFLDDLQWLDAATLDLLEDLLTQSDLRYLMLIGAYRDNEVDGAHPLTRKLDAIRQAGTRVQEIRLAPLVRDDLRQVIVDALRCESERAAPLAQLVHDKTGGNPFFALQFISALAEEGLLRFDHDAARWRWDVDRLHAKGYTDNVVELMVGKLTRLPTETQAALQQLACLGNIGEITMLSIVLGKSNEDVRSDLWDAVRLELLVEHLDGSYKFVHDRVQEAAYSLIPERLRAEAHLRVGRLLAAHTPAERREEAIFDIVNQLNRGAALITSQGEREQLAEFNLLAGQRAKASAAYASALTYFIAGAALLPEDSWESRHDLTFALQLNRAECEFLTGALAEAEARSTALSARAANTVEHATVACLREELFTTLDRSDRSVDVALDYLRRVGVAWSAHPTQDEVRREYELMWRQIGSRPIEALLDLPRMADPVWRATMDVLSAVVSPALYTDQNLYNVVIGRMANLSLQHGNTDASSYAYAILGTVLGAQFGDYKAAFRFSQVGFNLAAQRGLDRFKARVYLIFGHHVMPWTKPIRTSRSLMRFVLDAAQEAGDLTYGAFGHTHLITHLLASGDPLDEVQREAEAGLDFARQARFGLVVDRITGQFQLIRTLRGLTPIFGHFDDAGFDEERFEQHLEADPRLALAACWYWIRKLQARVLAGDHAAAIAAAAKANCRLWTSPAFFERAEYHFYAALARAACCDAAPDAERTQHVEAVVAHHRQLKVWATNCSENFEHRATLVGAEISRIEGRALDAMDLYEQAIRLARANGFVHDEALAYELAARLYAARGFEEFAGVYLRNARDGYVRWGADGKVRQLEQLHPHLREAAIPASATPTIGASVEQLDVGTVVKASQAVSREIVLGELIKTLLRIAVEHAGAQRGLLILFPADEPRIAAEATTGRGQFEVTLRDAVPSPAELPEALLHTVIRTRRNVILDDGLAQNPFSADEYIGQKRARSVLCLPLVKQAELIGVLYLENNLASHVFTPTRISVLELLASQAAISLENARLYNDLREREARIRRLVDSNIIGVMIWNFQGRIIEANEAVLDMLGYSHEELIASRIGWAELTPAEWASADEDALAQVGATGSCRPYEKEYLRKDGSRVPVLIAGALFEWKRDEGVAFIIDITDRKRAEENLRKSEERFRDYAETASDWLWETGPDHRIISISEHVDALDIAPSRVPGVARWEIASDVESEPEKWRLHREMLDTHQPFRDFVYSILSESGSPVYVRASGKPIFDEKGNFLGYRGTGADITAIIRADHAEEALRKARMELAHVTRVTMLGELTASIAHEVSQPLAAIISNAEACLQWLGRGVPDLYAARRSAEWIVDDGNRASEVMRRVRALAKKNDVEKTPLDINNVVGEVIALVQHELISHGVSLQTRFAPALPNILGDRVQLQQVIINLVMNGIEAMQPVMDRPRELVIRSRQEEAHQVRISVADSGVGISADNADRLFNAFFTTKANGMGMGLSICRSIVEAHDGRLWAEANVPCGTSFQFTLPVKAAD